MSTDRNLKETNQGFSKSKIEMHLKRCSECYGLTNHQGKSTAGEKFFDIYYEGTRIPDMVACKECKKVYTFKVPDGVHSLLKHKCGKHSIPILPRHQAF